MPLPTGVAISRPTMDTHFLRVAGERGATVHKECTALIKDVGETVTATLNGDPQEFDCVVLAAGLNVAGGQRFLPWTEQPHGPFGVSFTIPVDQGSKELVSPGVIYMVCNADGYVGLVQLESDRIDIASAIQSGSNASRGGTPLERVKKILEGSPFATLPLQDHSKIMTTPQLRRTRVAGRGRVMAIGDSAGYVEPFTGEGMTWAMKSGIAAADCISQSEDNFATVGDQWAQRSAKLLRSQKRTCRVLTSALNWTPTRRLIGFGLSTMPAIARPLVTRLNR